MSSIDRSESRSAAESSRTLFFPIERLLPRALIESWCREIGHRWRKRRWDPMLTLLSFVRQMLEGRIGIRAAEQWGESFGDRIAAGRADGADYCRARMRLPEAIYWKALRTIGEQVAGKAAGGERALRAFFIDGTTFRGPRTAANVQGLGCSRSRHGDSHHPLMRAVMRVCAQTGAVCDAQLGPYRQSERSQLRNLMHRTPAGSLLIVDRGFCSLIALWYAQRRGIHMLCRLHQSRPLGGRRIGNKEWITQWARAGLRFMRCVAWKDLAQQVDQDLPVRVLERMVLRRGYRPWRLRLCTTLLDPRKHPADELVRMYLGRWAIETDFRSLKTRFGLKPLRAKTPEMARKEVCAALIALTVTAGWKCGGTAPPRRIGTESVVRLLLFYGERMVEASKKRCRELEERLRAEILRNATEFVQRPAQPRAIVANPVHYKPIATSRTIWRKLYLETA